jgi:hypothetical protein
MLEFLLSVVLLNGSVLHGCFHSVSLYHKAGIHWRMLKKDSIANFPAFSIFLWRTEAGLCVRWRKDDIPALSIIVKVTFNGKFSIVVYLENLTMTQFKCFSVFFMTILLAFLVGCAATPKQEGTGEYIDDTILTTKVKTAIFNEPTLKSAEINVETFKGVVQLSGFLGSRADVNKAAEVARGVTGVKSVKNDMRVK